MQQPITVQRWPGWMWLVVGASAALLVLELFAAGVGVYVLAKPYPQSAAFNCLPASQPIPTSRVAVSLFT